MERTIGAFDARRMFGKVLNEVAANGDHYIVERHGQPIAAVVPMRIYEQWKRDRDAFFDHIEATANKAHMNEGEAMDLALDAIRAHRAARSADDR